MSMFTEEPPVDDREPALCPACDGRGSKFIPWVGTLVCEWCHGEPRMAPEDADAICEAMEDEAVELESLLATCRDTDLTEVDFAPPPEAPMTEAELEAMFAWHEANTWADRIAAEAADPFANDWKGRA